MPHLLLLGAGFSRNWGGWLASEAFEYLLGCPEIASNPHLRALLWRYHATGGFEDALAQVQSDFRRDQRTNLNHLQDLQGAIDRMFKDMNTGYFDNQNFEFHGEQERHVGRFLAKFDAIFTLNQDVLLEHHYFDKDISLISNRRWDAGSIPGMRPRPDQTPFNPNSWARRIWVNDAEGGYQVRPRTQPLFKLHGSSNWNADHGGPLLIIGGNKAQEIEAWPVLTWYHRQFREYISAAGARLMVIGYGFRDPHINEALIEAINNHRLRLFVIAPDGANLARAVNPTNNAGVRAVTELEHAFERGLIGASRRSMREIFGMDSIEFSKVNRFFET